MKIKIKFYYFFVFYICPPKEDIVVARLLKLDLEKCPKSLEELEQEKENPSEEGEEQAKSKTSLFNIPQILFFIVFYHE